MMNRLRHALSPYLLQHADQPVDWYAWDAEALTRARTEDKPILLSIGYSACHWCHVMAHESFADPAIAATMNRLFVNIKVDREERPDLDKIYQAAHQLLTRARGGWPLTMFLDPDDHVPFFGGTYFPPQARYGRPGFAEVLQRVATAYRMQRAELPAVKQRLLRALASMLDSAPSADNAADPIALACTTLASQYDPNHGGFGGAPKFPHPFALELLLAAGSTEQLAMVDHTLSAMAAGGIRDHLSGGFFRYSTDVDWSIPHFEKMLYDNAALLALYTDAWVRTGNADLRDVIDSTAQWLQHTMQLADGGFAASLAADADGGEGAYYVWQRDEIERALGVEAARFAHAYGLDQPANFAGRWHLRERAGVPRTDYESLAAARVALVQVRTARSAPARDDKVLTAWNALAIRALVRAGRARADARYLDSAFRAFDYLATTHWRDGRLQAVSRDNRGGIGGFLDDYAFLLSAALEVLRTRWRTSDLTLALALAECLLDHFADPIRGGFYFTADDHEDVLVRVRGFADDATPNGNAVAAVALAELGQLVGDTRYSEQAARTLAQGRAAATHWPDGHAALLCALHAATTPGAQIVLRADALPAAWQHAIAAGRAPHASYYVIATHEDNLPGALALRRPLAGAAVTAYVCREFTCSAPLTRVADFRDAIAP